jgi:sugar-specific transcriptional regulator TrmB
MAKDAAKLLVEFGFTDLEAEIYLFLLGSSPTTGYRVAKGIRKPAANTYKALQTLATKGAILVEDGSVQQVRAIPYHTLLDRLERDFSKRQAAARKAFQSFEVPTTEEGVFQIAHWEAMVQFAIELIGGASSEVLALGDLSDLGSALTTAAGRGVSVVVASTTPIGIAEEVKVAGLQQSISVLIDGKNYLAFRGDQGIWVSKQVAAQQLGEALRAQIQVAEITERLEEGAGANRIARVLNVTRPGKAEKN